MKENRSAGARTQRDTSRSVKLAKPQPDHKSVLRRVQNMLGNLLGRRDRSDIGRQTMFQGLHTEHQLKELRRRRAKNKIARKQRVYNARRGRK